MQCEFGYFQNKFGCIECKCDKLNTNLFNFKNNKSQIEKDYNNIIITQTTEINQKSLNHYLIDKANNSNKLCIIISAENCNK